MAPLLFVPAALAEESSREPDESRKIEEIVVVGTRIKRFDFSAPGPVLVIDRDEIEATGLTEIGDILQQLPSSGAAINQAFNNPRDFDVGGATFFDLRDLGPERVLVLVNGRRWARAAAAGTSAAVDLTTIPAAIVERIEILKDGASAVYGSDAVAGVVNVITRRDFDGIEAGAYYGQYEAGDGEVQSYDITWGKGAERGSAVLNLSYRENRSVMAGDRRISADAVFGTAIGSFATPQGLFVFCEPGLPTTLPFCEDTGGALRIVTVREGAGPISRYPQDFRPFDATSDLFNFAPFNFLVIPQERFSLYGQADYEIAERVRLSVEFLYGKRESNHRIAPLPLGLPEGLTIPADHPFSPFDFDLTDARTPVTNPLRRFLEAGERRRSFDVETVRLSVGLNGGFDALGRQFEWEVAHTYSENDRTDRFTGNTNIPNLRQALGPPEQCTDPCVPLNIFGGQGPDGSGTITREMLDFILFEGTETFRTTQHQTLAGVTGELLELPAGPLAFAAGYEFRREEAEDRPDAAIIAGTVSAMAPRQPTEGGFDVHSAYLELAFPVLKDRPLARNLDFIVATRYSDFETFGETTNSRLALQYRPVSELLVRSTLAEGFRAPYVGNLAQPRSAGTFFIFDPCSDFLALEIRETPQPQNIIDNCIAQGLPADGSFVEPAALEPVILGGNPDLEPEESESWTFGLVYSPEVLSGLDVALDLWSIDIENAIIPGLGADVIVESCAASGLFCESIERGVPDSPHEIVRITDVARNIGGVEASGIDAGIRYAFPATSAGNFRVHWQATVLEEFIRKDPDPGSPSGLSEQELTGMALSDFDIHPRWRSNLALDWTRGPWQVHWFAEYIDDLTEPCSVRLDPFTPIDIPCSDVNQSNPNQSSNELDSVIYHDVRLTFRWDDARTRFAVGVNNVFAEAPPISFGVAFQNNFLPAIHRVPGRFFYVDITTRF